MKHLSTSTGKHSFLYGSPPPQNPTHSEKQARKAQGVAAPAVDQVKASANGEKGRNVFLVTCLLALLETHCGAALLIYLFVIVHLARVWKTTP